MARFVRLAALVLALAAPLAAQDDRQHAEARERWSRMSAAERAEIERRFEAFRRMDAVQRHQLEDRMGHLREAKKRARERLPRETRKQLDRLGPAKREEIVSELTRENVSERGRDLLERMPAEWRERIEGAAPAERPRLLRKLKEQNRGTRMEHAFDRLGEELSLSDEEIRRMKSLPLEQREAELLALSRRAMERETETGGLPDWISEAEWKSWKGLPPREFHERRHMKRREAGIGPGRGRRDAHEGAEHLRRLTHPDPTWRLELQDLSPSERRAEIERRLKERLLEFLEQRRELVTEEELERLRGLSGRELMDATREQRRRGADRGSRDGQRPGRPGPRPPGRPPSGETRGRPDGRRGGGG